MHISNRVKVIFAIFTLLTGLGMIGGAWWKVQESNSQAQARVNAEKRDQAVEVQRRRYLLSMQIAALINVEEEANRVAVMRAENDLRDIFQTYADRTPQFAAAVTGVKNSLIIAYQQMKDFVSGTTEVRQLTADLFAQHIVSDKQIAKDLNKIVAQFRSDATANRNRMLTEVALRIREADLGIFEVNLSQETMLARLSNKEQEALMRTVGESPWLGLLAISGSMIAGWGAEQLVAAVIKGASGSMIAVALAGGQAGTVVSPGVGSAIGIAVGLAIGLGINHWTTKQMTIAIEQEARLALITMRGNIWRDPSTGLKVKFDSLVSQTRDMHAQVLRDAVFEEKS